MVKKRGRKRKVDLYFGPEQERAVVDFLQEEDYELRNEIFNTYLRDALNTMIDSIIRRYKLYRDDISFESLHSDALSYLILKSDKFDPTLGKKAYSYYGTICKNYILGLKIKDVKYNNQTLDFDSSMTKIHENDAYSYELVDSHYELSNFIKTISEEIREELRMESEDGKKKMTDNEKKVGKALVDILDNWENIFENFDGGSKYNKNTILATIRENTGLVTKDIRIAMKRFKKIYGLIKSNKIDEGYL